MQEGITYSLSKSESILNPNILFPSKHKQGHVEGTTLKVENSDMAITRLMRDEARWQKLLHSHMSSLFACSFNTIYTSEILIITYNISTHQECGRHNRDKGQHSEEGGREETRISFFLKFPVFLSSRVVSSFPIISYF